MMTNFNIADFDVISIQSSGEAEMHLNKRYLTFTKSLIEEMGCPPYVRVLVNAKDQMVALQACKPTDENAYKFSQPRGLQKKAKYCCRKSIKKSILAVIGNVWDESNFYGCRGLYLPEQKAMIFDMKNIYKRNVEFLPSKRT